MNKDMSNLKLKRFMAYCIDLLIVLILIMGLNSINFLHPHAQEAKEYINKLNEIADSHENTTLSEKEQEEYTELLYKASKAQISNNICSLVVIVGYFTLFPLANKNMTVGKRLFKITVVNASSDKQKVSFWQHLVKALLVPIYASIILTNSFSYLGLALFPLILKGKTFMFVASSLNYLICIYCYIDIVMDVCKADGRGLSDKLAKLKVVEYVRD